ncbi:MAG TPA: relaxase/mobilization nuclease domain-containing protein [Pyrinomonadaceae bacterium]
MIVNVSKGESFEGTVRYVMNQKKERAQQERESNEKVKEPTEGHVAQSLADEKAIIDLQQLEEVKGIKVGKLEFGETQILRGTIIGGNAAGTTTKQLAREFSQLQTLRPDIKKPVLHISVSTPRGEMDSPEKKEEIAEFLLKKLVGEIKKTTGVKIDFQNTLYVIVSHSDTEHDHFHIVASRICFDGTVIPDSMERYVGQEAARAAEKQFGLTQLETSREVKKKGLTRGELYRYLEAVEEFEKNVVDGKAGEKDRPPAPVKLRLQDSIDVAVRGFPTAGQFLIRLEKAGIEVIPRLREDGLVTGISYRLGKELRKGSNLGRNYTWPGLIERGLNYEKIRDGKEIGRAADRESDRRDGARRVAGAAGQGVNFGRSDEADGRADSKNRRGDKRETRRDRARTLQPAAGHGTIREEHRADGGRRPEATRGDQGLRRGDTGEPSFQPGAATRDSQGGNGGVGRTPETARHRQERDMSDGSRLYERSKGVRERSKSDCGRARGLASGNRRNLGENKHLDEQRKFETHAGGSDGSQTVSESQREVVGKDLGSRNRERASRGANRLISDLDIHHESNRHDRGDGARCSKVDLSYQEARNGKTGIRGGAQPSNRARDGEQHLALEARNNSSRQSSSESSVKQLQRLLRIQAEPRTLGHEKTQFNSDKSNLLHETGILLGERMVKLVEYHASLNTKPAEGFKVLETLRAQIDKLNTAISACSEIAGRDPVPILTKEQREYIESYKEGVQGSVDKAELYEGLQRAVTLDCDYSTKQQFTNEPEQIIEQNAAKEITL